MVNKQESIHLRIEDSLLLDLDNKAKEKKVSLSEYIRSCIKEGKTSFDKSDQEEKQLLIQRQQLLKQWESLFDEFYNYKRDFKKINLERFMLAIEELLRDKVIDSYRWFGSEEDDYGNKKVKELNNKYK